MATIEYTLDFDDTNRTGLTLSFTTFKKVSDNTVVSAPSISELGDGFYKFSFDMETVDSDLYFVADDSGSNIITGRMNLKSLETIPGDVWDVPIADHLDTGSTGEALNNCSTNDPLGNPVPNGYPQGTAGWVLGQLTRGNIVIVSPVSAFNNVEIIRGDDYTIAIDRAIEWTDTTGAFPDLTGATITFNYGTTFSKTMSVLNVGTANQVLQLELTAAETDAFECINDAYNITAVLTSGEICTLVIGKFIIRDDL